MRARDQSSIFSIGGKFCPDNGLLLELHTLTLVARSYALLLYSRHQWNVCLVSIVNVSFYRKTAFLQLSRFASVPFSVVCNTECKRSHCKTTAMETKCKLFIGANCT